MRLLRARNMDSVLLLVGRIISQDEVPELLRMGVGAVFGLGASTDEAVQHIREHVS
jgi:methylmalonyl-CoA mutase C-terminal domain/subunit